MQVSCSFPGGEDSSSIDPFPGSREARLEGCVCPEQRVGKVVYFESECPVHKLELVKPN